MACLTRTGEDGVLYARGFTLIELLVVLAIIALMLTIATPRYVDHVERARETTLRATLKEIRIAIDRFEGDQGRLPKSLDELVERRYLRELPIDPVTSASDTWVQVPADDLTSRTSAGAPADWPRTGDIAGLGDVRSGAPGSTRDGVPFSQL